MAVLVAGAMTAFVEVFIFFGAARSLGECCSILKFCGARHFSRGLDIG
jgi:hypothetical protein